MAGTVYFHVGLPKTGTTYLQTLLWANKDELGRQGVLLPGSSVREHLWASGVVREDPRLARRTEAALGAWDRLIEEMNIWPGTALISHEFFAAASADQAKRAMDAIDGADVHVVVTARETVSLVTARWQEWVKNGGTTPIDGYPVTEDTSPDNEWDWGTLDLADVLNRWSDSLARDHVHVVTLPGPSEPRDALWQRFTKLIGIDASRCDTSRAEKNQSLGVVEVELLRRVNADLVDFTSALDRCNWIRGYLAQGKLVPRNGEKFWPSPERVAELRIRSARSVDHVEAAGYDVIGNIEDLRTPADLPERRHPDSVTDTEVLAAATLTIAEMMTDVRRLTRTNHDLRGKIRRLHAALPPPAVPVPPPPRRLRTRVLNRVRRVWRRP
jgi:hypothetical protein